ncbi:MAG: hypothetical protein IPO81_00615 [Kouleothrix sp.]|nr:hypothetical protein [Kouleothrix sp.]
MSGQYLVLFDADRIRDYVFATGRLKEIRGASELVRQVTDEKKLLELKELAHFQLKKWQPDEQEGLIYAGGGAGALLFADEERARSFCAELERLYRQRTGGATLSAVWVEVQGSSVEAQQLAARSLAARKASRPRSETIPGGAVLRFCASDRLYPASVRAPDPDNPAGLLVSEMTAIKRHGSHTYRQALEKSDFWQVFESLVSASARMAWRAAISDTNDLGHISEQARPQGYVALVYADGDGVGGSMRQVVAQLGFEGYQQFSAALADAAIRATAEALAVAYRASPIEQPNPDRETRETRFLPFEVITIGGDDVILICTAERGLAVACELSRRLGKLVNDWVDQYNNGQSNAQSQIVLDQPFSASVGVIIAHDSVPIVQLERRGHDLLDSAKQAKQSGLGGIDFHVITTPGLDGINQTRSRDYSADNEKTCFTKRPYPLHRAELLLRYARHLRGLCDSNGIPVHLQSGTRDRQLTPEEIAELPHLPDSKIADLYTACRGSRIEATLDVLTVSMRLRERERKALLQALHDLESIKYYPFDAPDEEGVFRSALPDLLEALSFVAEEG